MGETLAMLVAATEPLREDLWPALVDLFGPGGASNGCWCMYWILGAEYHKRPRAMNEQALRIAAELEPAPGLLALDDSGTAVGWCRVTPRVQLNWLNARGEFPPVDDVAVWSVPCFFVRRGCRREGVMALLISGAIEHARAGGAPALEAYPVDTSLPGATRNIFSGTVAAFEEAGFVVVARRNATRPIMRYDLTDQRVERS